MTETGTDAPTGRRLRIAFVSDAVYPFNTGGKERRLHEITTRLAALGHQVDIYTMKWWDGGSQLHREGVTMHAIAPLMPLYQGERRSTTQALRFGLATLKLIAGRFDVLDVDHMPFFPLFSARVVASVRRRRLLATWHEVWGKAYWRSYLGRGSAAAWMVERLAAAMPDGFVSVSEQTSTQLRSRLGVSRRPIWTLPLGVDVTRLSAFPASTERPDILYAGRLLAHKRVDVLVRAVAVLAATEPQVRCRIVGAGPELPRLMRLAEDLGVAGNVEFSGFLPEPELFGLMKSARVFALPSVREGFGLVVLEANACDTPVVTVDHANNAARHLIEDGRNGYVCGLDEHALADALARAIRRPAGLDPAATLAAREPGVDWDSIVDRFCALLHKTVPAAKTAARPTADRIGAPA